MTAPFSVILCEGFHDRSFLAGALLHRLGWSDPGLGAGGRRVAQRDRWGTVTGGGKFGFRHSSGAELRLTPCHPFTAQICLAYASEMTLLVNVRMTSSFSTLKT